MFGFTIRRRSTVARHADDLARALRRCEDTLALLKGCKVEGAAATALRKHVGAMEVLHYRMERAAMDAGLDVTPLSGGGPKPEPEPEPKPDEIPG
jgi:hypothetical protein